MIILYAYEGKILLAWDLPKGWVSNLVLLSAVAGILAFLLLHPLKQTTDWVRRFNKAYYVALVPLVGLLFVAIYVRINEYGVTEPRYFVATLAVWLLGIVLYFLFSRADNIKIIPISLFVLCMLSIVGPWGAFSASDRSQLNRLYRVLETNKWLKNGKISIPDTAINGPDLGEVDATLFYFADRQSYLKLQPLFTQSLDSLRNKSTYDRRYQLANWSNLTVVRPEASQSARYFYSTSGENGEINISGYDYMLKGYHPVYAQSAAADTTQRKVSVSWQDSTQSLVIRLNSKTLLMSMTRRIGEMAVLETSVVPDEKMQLEAENDQLKAKLLMENVNIDPQRKHLQSMNYKLLVKEK